MISDFKGPQTTLEEIHENNNENKNNSNIKRLNQRSRLFRETVLKGREFTYELKDYEQNFAPNHRK
eukprot:UN10536